MNKAALLSSIWAGFWIYWLISAFGSKRNDAPSKTKAGGRLLFSLLAIIFLTTWLHRLRPAAYTPTDLLSAIGFVLLVVGLGLCIWARLYIGRDWGMPMTEKPDTRVITTGPYQFIRHPIYTGLLVTIVGTCCITGFYWLIILAIAGPYFVYSAIVEESNLERKLPQIYRDYKQTTKMFIPFVI